MRLSSFAFALTFGLAAAILTIAAGAEESTKKADGKSRPKVTISKETTFITAPLRPDGYPDYTAAFDEIAGRGVTPENNAAVLLQQAFGPAEIPEKLRADYFRKLGIKPLPEKGDYFVTRDEMVKRWRVGHPQKSLPDDESDDLSDEFDRAIERPWTAKDFPMVAEWLRINEKLLKLIEQATQKPKLYFPVLNTSDGPLIGRELPHIQQIREVGQVLVAKAMYLAGQDKVAEAWQTLLACHRLARLLYFEPGVIELLIGYAVDGMATKADVALIHSTRLTKPQIDKMLRNLQALPPTAGVTPAFDVAERFTFLDTVLCVAREGPNAFRTLLIVAGNRINRGTHLTLT